MPDNLTEYYSDEDFIYGEAKVDHSQGFFQRWLSRLLNKLFGSSEGGKAWEIFFWIVVSAAVITIIILTIKTRISNVVYGQPAAANADIRVADEDIHETDLEGLLQNAVSKGQYREAIRYKFLLLLKYLSEKNMIHWSPDKTNRDYQRELANTGMSTDFSRAVAVYEYIWYGNYPLDEEGWAKQQVVFNNLQNYHEAS